ncbi:hypothetical protein D4764_08G0006330 [Takifugu flavidus]|uniref:Uncharacterized protein n=1 Tax=Takifugu flavidus TaxID=433684 RepID=A0A5C6MNB3_9TELE|nr:hypothetical protein D4764_08G0006330 [Takifugu flavidus]
MALRQFALTLVALLGSAAVGDGVSDRCRPGGFTPSSPRCKKAPSKTKWRPESTARAKPSLTRRVVEDGSFVPQSLEYRRGAAVCLRAGPPSNRCICVPPPLRRLAHFSPL